ncbi:MAG: hypothetical protein U1E65_27110 [Myxococcota bacterium]
MKKPLLALAALTLFGLTAHSRSAEAQQFTLRASADIQPIVAFADNGQVLSLDKAGSLGIHIAPGLRLASILTLEVDLVPRIPLAGQNFNFTVLPGVFLDLWLLYVRGGVPISFIVNGDPNFAIEGGVGISFLGKGHVGLAVNYNFTAKTFQLLGLEVGYRFDLGG